VLELIQYDLLARFANSLQTLENWSQFCREFREWGIAGNCWKNFSVVNDKKFVETLLAKADRRVLAIILSLASCNDWLNSFWYGTKISFPRHAFFPGMANPWHDWNLINSEKRKLHVGPVGTLAPF